MLSYSMSNRCRWLRSWQWSGPFSRQSRLRRGACQTVTVSHHTGRGARRNLSDIHEVECCPAPPSARMKRSMTRSPEIRAALPSICARGALSAKRGMSISSRDSLRRASRGLDPRFAASGYLGDGHISRHPQELVDASTRVPNPPYSNALSPVISRPTMSALMSCVPS
jgi:hypothetical protein